MNADWCKEVNSGALLLTVNQRLSRHYVREHNRAQLEAGITCWETPSILPLNAWLLSVHNAALVSGLSELAVLNNLASELAWQTAVESDPQSESLLDTNLAARGAMKAWQTGHAYDCLGNVRSSDHLSIDQQAFNRWRQHYESHCRQQGVIDSAMLATHVTDILRQHAATMSLPNTVFLAGYLVLSPQIKSLLDALSAAGVNVHRLQPDRTATKVRYAFADDESGLRGIASHVRLRLFPDNTANEAVGELVKPSQIGIVVNDLQQRRAEVLRTFDSVFFPGLNPNEVNKIGRPYDISIGWPLDEQTVVRTALLLLRLIVFRVDDKALSILLLSPYLPGSDIDRRRRERIDRRVRERRLRSVDFDSFMELTSDDQTLQRRFRRVLKRKWTRQAGAATWVQRFGTVLNDMNWPGSVDSDEYQAVDAWQTCLANMQSLDNGKQLDKLEALFMLERLCKQHVFQVQTPSAPIQIMGRLESHGIAFDELWVTGMDSESWPAVTSPTPFIPITQQQLAGVPDASPEARLAFAEKEIALWERSAHRLNMAYALSRDGLELNAAAIIEQYPESELDATGAAATYKLIQQSGALDAIVDTHGAAVADDARVKGGARLLENQAKCPFKAYATHRLNIKPLEEASIGLDPREHGNALHLVMELFWQRVKTHAALMSLEEEGRAALCEEIIAEVVGGMQLPQAQHLSLTKHLLRLMLTWVEKWEVRRLPFEVVETEGDRELSVAGLNIKLKIDRIDKLDSGELVVIDYKTGRNNSIATWTDERIENPQLPLYATTDDDVQGVAFAQVVPHQYKYIGVTAERNMLPRVSAQSSRAKNEMPEDWEALRSHWSESLTMLASEIKQGVATVTPTKTACQYCDLSGVCRIRPEMLAEQLQATDTVDVAEEVSS